MPISVDTELALFWDVMRYSLVHRKRHCFKLEELCLEDCGSTSSVRSISFFRTPWLHTEGDKRQCLPSGLKYRQCLPWGLKYHQCLPSGLKYRQCLPSDLKHHQCLPWGLKYRQCLLSGLKNRQSLPWGLK